MGITGSNYSPFSLAGRQEPINPGLILQTPPKAKYSQKSFGDIVEGQIVEGNYVADRDSHSQSKKNNSNQQGTNNSNASKEQMAYTNAYASSVREQIRNTTTQQDISRVNMTDLNQPITQKQFLALNQKLDTIGSKLDQLNSLLGSKSANTEAWNLKKASLIDNSHGNTEIDIA